MCRGGCGQVKEGFLNQEESCFAGFLRKYELQTRARQGESMTGEGAEDFQWLPTSTKRFNQRENQAFVDPPLIAIPPNLVQLPFL